MYKLLIVDDEPLIRRGIKTLANLSVIGISEILEAESGEEAVEISYREHPHIIVMDINMPNMDGLTASARIKEKLPDTFIIILTGYNYFEYAQTAIRAKVDDYILKPISKSDIESVLTKITRQLQEKQRRMAYMELRGSQNSAVEEFEEVSEMEGKIRAYMNEYLYSSELSLSKMSSDIGFNNNYLSGVFKQLYGVPFQEYVNRKRMEKAKLLLLSTPMKNYEVAEEVGIEDVNYFVTKFKKHWGVTPKQFRQGMR